MENSGKVATSNLFISLLVEAKTSRKFATAAEVSVAKGKKLSRSFEPCYLESYGK